MSKTKNQDNDSSLEKEATKLPQVNIYDESRSSVDASNSGKNSPIKYRAG